VDILYFAGTLLAAGCIVYGGWLSITVAEADPHNATGGRRPGGATPKAKPLPPRPCDVRRQERRVSASQACLVVCSIVVVLVLSGAALASEPLERGIEAYGDSRYQEAMAQFRLAADGGDARAQEILGFMYLHGPKLYGAAVPHDRDQAIHWFGRAAREGREVAQHTLCVLTGQPASTAMGRAACAGGTPTASANF
jgi:TPR repeat protein